MNYGFKVDLKTLCTVCEKIGKVEFGGLYNKEGFNLKGEPTIDLKEAIVSIGEKMIPEPILKSNAINRNELQQKQAESNFIAIGQFDTIGNIVTLENGFAGVITSEYFIDAALDKQVQSIGINPGNIRNNTLSGYDEESLQSTAIQFLLIPFFIKNKSIVLQSLKI